ncbi:MAG: glycosyltransferase family 9 protein [Gammaproteobacteria bacterium]|nr:glycosyltransferase family 9 protein [Gammaproteobacteria bacterium]
MSEPGDQSLHGASWNLDWPRGDGPASLHRQAHRAAASAVTPLHPVVFFFCRLGDMVMLTALLDRLHRRFRLPSYVIGAGNWNDAVFRGNPDVAGVWSFGRHTPFLLNRAWPQVLRTLRASAPGPVYVCEKHYRQLPPIRRMLRLGGVDPARCVFITDEPAGPAEHLVDRLLRLSSRTPAALRAGDYPVPAEAAAGPRLYVADAERAQRDAWLRAGGWAGRELILLQPGNHRSMGRRRARWRRTNADDKAWPLERWAALLRRMHARRGEALLVLRGAREEAPMLREIQAAAALDSVVVAGASLREFFALCEAARSMVSVDTGPAHAAAALDLPLVVLYGAESPHHWLPRSPGGAPVVGVVGPPPSTRVDQIALEAVFDAWCSLEPHARAVGTALRAGS